MHWIDSFRGPYSFFKCVAGTRLSESLRRFSVLRTWTMGAYAELCDIATALSTVLFAFRFLDDCVVLWSSVRASARALFAL